MESKVCKRCNKHRLLSDFKKNSATKSGYAAECKKCNNERYSEWLANRSDEQLEDRKEYSREYQKTYTAKDISKRRNQYRVYKLKSKYNMTEADLNKMILDHDNKCAICSHEFGSDMTDRMNRYNIDHCHTLGLVRGLLCTRCNTVLGKVNDDPELLQCMINYLRHSLN